MKRIKWLIAGSSLLIAFLWAKPAYAANVSIQKLGSYITSNNFPLSCSALGGSSAQFSVSKHGGAPVAFGPAINLTTTPCQVQVTSSEVNDQTDYTFTVTIDGTTSDSTSTFYDISGPSPVSNFSKERIDDGTYKLHWTNPGDSDFSQVIIYRGDTTGFSADSGHEIARVSGGANSDMSYDDHFTPDASKTYFYLLRAIDKAGNSSSLVGDGGSTTTTSSPAPVLGASTGTSGKVTQLPKEGNVLGAQASASPTPTMVPTPESTAIPAAATGGIFNWIFGHKKISLGVAIVLLLGGYFVYKSLKK